MTAPAPGGPWSPRPNPPAGLPPLLAGNGDLAAQAGDLIRAVTAGAISDPADRLQRARTTGAAMRELLRATPAYQSPAADSATRLPRPTLDGWIALGFLAGYLYGSPVSPIVQSCTEHKRGYVVVVKACTNSGEQLSAAVSYLGRDESAFTTASDLHVQRMAQIRGGCEAMYQAIGWLLVLPASATAPAPAPRHDDPDTMSEADVQRHVAAQERGSGRQ